MTPERRAEIEDWLGRITPGAWFYETRDGSVQSRTIEDDGWVNEDIVYYIANADQDGPFLAAAPSIIRELLAEIDRLNDSLSTGGGGCVTCGRYAPLVDGECPDCRH